MDNFNAHKWFKKQYLEEGMSDEEIHAIKRYEELSNEDKLKLAKIQAMMDRERSLREDDLDEIAFGAAGTDKRTGQVISEIIQMIRNTGIDPSDVMEEIGQEFRIAFEFGRG
jgi:uncharacterized protein (DUF433 family)